MTIDPESLRRDAPRLFTPDGVQPVGVAPDQAYFARLATSPDGTTTKISSSSSTYPVPLRSASWPTGGGGVLTLPPRDAAMLGLYHLLRTLTWQSFDLAAVVEGMQRQAAITIHQLLSVDLHWPDWSATDSPVGRALITSIDEATYEQPSEVHLLEETYGMFGADTVLRHLGTQTFPLQIVCWCAHKDQRRGLEARLLDELAAEKIDDRPGRRLVIPEYFGRIGRYFVTGTMTPDDADRVAAHEFVLEVSVNAEVEHVSLVYGPGFVEAATVDVATE